MNGLFVGNENGPRKKKFVISLQTYNKYKKKKKFVEKFIQVALVLLYLTMYLKVKTKKFNQGGNINMMNQTPLN